MFNKDESSKAESKQVSRVGRRRQRGVHGRARQKLTVPEIEGYYCRWVNDVDNKLHEATVADDFSHVLREEINDSVGEAGDGNSDLGSQVRVLVDKDEHGIPIYAYLLKKKQEFFDEDLAENEAIRLEKENTLRRGSDKIENQYGSIT